MKLIPEIILCICFSVIVFMRFTPVSVFCVFLFCKQIRQTRRVNRKIKRNWYKINIIVILPYGSQGRWYTMPSGNFSINIKDQICLKYHSPTKGLTIINEGFLFIIINWPFRFEVNQNALELNFNFIQEK